MADLIIMPGPHSERGRDALNPRTPPEVRVILTPEEAKDSVPAYLASPQALVGRTLTLDWTKATRYQTYKFYLGRSHPFAKVPPDAALEDLQQALLTGLLIDVTDQHIKGVSDANGNHLSPVGVSDDPDARMVFIGSEKHEGVISGPKPLFIAIPEDEKTEQDYLKQVMSKGRIDGLYAARTPDVMMSGISVSDIDEDRPPIASKEPGFWALILKAFKQLFR
jgi:hypothetical protein